MDLNLKFEASRQSMWGPGTAIKPAPIKWNLIGGTPDPFLPGINWNFTAPNHWPGMATVDTYFWGDAKFGVEGRASTFGGVEFSATLDLLEQGSVDVTYPVASMLTFPDINDFRAGDTVAVSTVYSRTDGWQLTTSSPAASFRMDTSVRANVDLFARVCVVECVDTNVLKIWPGTNLSIDESATLAVATGSVFDTGATPYFSGSMAVPQIVCFREGNATTGCRSDADGLFDLRASGSGSFLPGRARGVFASGTLHIADIIKKAIDRKVKNTTYDWVRYAKIRDTKTLVRYATIDYEVAAIDLEALFIAEQAFRFAPDLKVTLQFPRELEYWRAATPGEVHTGTAAEMPVGETLYIRTPSDSKAPMELQPTFRLDNTFTSKTTFTSKENLPIRLLDVDVTLPEITIIPRLCTPGFCVDTIFGEACVPEVCTPHVSYNPPDFGIPGEGLWTPTFALAQQEIAQLPSAGSQSWELQGFQTHAAGALLLDPENPIVTVVQSTGAITRLPEGGRLVPFVIDMSNGGDVPLGSLVLTNDLQNAFPAVRKMNLDRVLSFGVAGNAAYDGISNLDLLAPPLFIGHPSIDPPPGNAVLFGGAPKRLIVYARVYPQPDPPPFTGTSSGSGASPLWTEVTAMASSSALLGPGRPATATDFVLFGDHFVKLQGSAAILGDIGSNDFIEVKQGLSGNVAGDLRAGRTVKVAGKISADYVFSGGIVDVVGKGELKLFGSLNPFQRSPSFTMKAPPFEPPTPLIGDVWIPADATQTLAPGFYGEITVNSGGTLSLTSGPYFIRTLHMAGGARTEVTGPATLTIADLVIGNGAALASTGWSNAVIIHAVQTHALEIGAGAAIRGSLRAPRSNVVFGAGSSIEGSVYAKSITLAAGASASHHRVCDPVIDADCDGVTDDPSIGQ